MDWATYRHVLSQIKESCPLSHTSFPCHNLVSQDTLRKLSRDFNKIEEQEEEEDDCDSQKEFLSEFPCYKPFDYRVELSCALLCGSCGKDLASDLVKRKLSWKRKLIDLKVSNIDRAIRGIKYLRKKQPKKLPEDVINYIQHFEDDPEPMFQGRYNWLYSGGNLQCVRSENDVVLISSDYETEFPTINIIKLDESLEKVDFKSSYKVKNASPILQLATKSNNENLFILIRQKDYVNLLKTDKSCFTSPSKLWKKKTLGSKLLVCADVRDDCEKVILSDTNREMHVFDVETKSKVYGCSARTFHKSDRRRDKWSHVMFGDLGIHIALRECLCVLDIRDNALTPNFVYTPSMTEICDEICSVTKSQCDPNYLYLGTTHHLLQVDLRNQETVQRWTHLMKNPPQFISSVQDDGRDFLVIQSERIDERLGITNDYINVDGEYHFLSRSLPCLLKSVKESLKLARFSGLCLSPVIPKRFSFAVTGNHCLKNKDGDLHVYTGNSGGDVFLTKVKRGSAKEMEKDEREARVLESMKDYEDHCKSIAPSKLDDDSFEHIDMEGFLKDLVHSRREHYTYIPPDMLWRNHEMYDPQSLVMCKDMLAQKLLRVWRMGVTEPELDEPSISSETKVREWIEQL